MRVRIEKGRASGVVAAPPSKSIAHRLLICAGLSEGESRLSGVSDCEDVKATLDCLAALGVTYEKTSTIGDIKVVGCDIRSARAKTALPCRESGSTLRFLIPPALMSGKEVIFTGASGLMRRPLSVYEQLAADKGFYFDKHDDTVRVRGPLSGGEYSVAGDVSSQFVSGLLFALPLAEKDSVISLRPPVESRSYINLTLNALGMFGIEVKQSDKYTYHIAGGQKYKPTAADVEGDYSGSAFLHALNLFGGNVTVTGLNEHSAQGDKAYEKFFPLLQDGTPTINIEDCPDLGPILFAVAAAKNGATFRGTRRLQIKESDRAAGFAAELRKLGASVEVGEDTVVINPQKLHAPSEPLSSLGDHRTVMALSVLLTTVGGEIDGAEAVSKSYPRFFRDLCELGINVTES